jgi:hypothetical protein
VNKTMPALDVKHMDFETEKLTMIAEPIIEEPVIAEPIIEKLAIEQSLDETSESSDVSRATKQTQATTETVM